MKKAYVFLANGFEEVEALVPVDVLRRGGVEVVTVAIEEDMPVVTGAHGVPVMADVMADDCLTWLPKTILSLFRLGKSVVINKLTAGWTST